MAAHNVVFAVDVDYRTEKLNLSRDLYVNNLKQWILKVLLSLGSKYGFENVRWGYKFFHSRTVKSAGLITRATDFKELQEKAFNEFETEFVHKVDVNRISSDEKPRLRASPAICVQNTLKEIVLDFQWDRPDITSPTKLSLRPRRSTRNTTNIPLADDDISCQGKNIVFVVSECPYSRSQLLEFLQLHSKNVESQRDLPELVLPKGLIDMLIHRKVFLHWADCSSCEVNHEAGDFTGLKTILEALQPVAGKVIPVLMAGMKHKHTNRENNGLLVFPTGSSIGCIVSSEKTYKRSFPALVGTLCWGADKDKQTCSVSLEPVSCRQRCLTAPIEVTLRSVLHTQDTCCLQQSASECWVLFCPQKSKQNQVALQSLFRELFIPASDMLAEVSEGGQVHSAVLTILCPNMALLTILQGEGALSTSHVPSELPDTLDLPDIVRSVLKDIMKDEDTLEQSSPHQIPEWASQELQQWANLTTEIVEGWYPLSDQSGISCHLMESMRLLHAAPEEQEQTEDESHEQEMTNSLAELYQNNKDGSNSGLKGKKRGTQRTPVRQKMKTMSRSLQMLNVARFNVKAQKNQTEIDSSSSTKGTEKRGKRGSSERTRPGPMYFQNEEELLSYLNLKYQQAVEDKTIALITQVRDLLSVVETFSKNNTDAGATFLNLIKKNILKSSQSIRQLYGSNADTESKIRDCQLQVVLSLELCKLQTSDDQDHVEQLVAGMLRVISLTKDPVYLSKFMQDEVLPLYLTGIPKVLADVYHSLGTQLPEVLVAVLPADFFSDDSVAKESVSVSPSPLSATQSLVSSVGDRLEELRNRSAKKRRNSGENDTVIVEESPVKPATDLRRSPRIKKLARRHSSVFYSSSQPRSRNLDRALSSSQLPMSESKGDVNVKAVKSPMRLLFGAAESPARPSASRAILKDAEVVRPCLTDSVFENCDKTPRKSPRLFPKSQPFEVLGGSSFKSPASKKLMLETPKKSPLKSILKTPVKSFTECRSPSGPSVISPNMKTPRKSVTWSPSPWKGLPEQSFKVLDSPSSTIRYSPRLITPSKQCKDQGEIFKTPEKSSQRKSKMSPQTAVGPEKPQLSQGSKKVRETLGLPETGEPQSLNIHLYDHPSPPTPEVKTPSKSPGPTHTMCTRSGRTPLKCFSTLPLDRESDSSSLTKERLAKPACTLPSLGGHTAVGTYHPTTLSTDADHHQDLHCETWTSKCISEQNENIQTVEEASSSDSQQFDSSQFSATSTEESIDIAEASVVKTELTGGIKMNISFSRKSSKSSEVFKFTGTPVSAAKSMQGGNRYGFRQTPDRQQRKAAARLGYSPGFPVFSRPQASGTPVNRKKQFDEHIPQTYQVELEMQASGLPKLKFKRTDSFNSGETSDCAAKGLVSSINNKQSRVNSPLTHCSKHREPGCLSPSHCTPGKVVQKYICQSITPTRLLTNSPSPLGHGEHMPWTPSPQSRGRSTPENFRTWPRKKRARTGLLGNKDIKEGTEILEDPELDGVFRLPGTEEPKELKDTTTIKYTLGIPSKLCSVEEMDWAESVVHNCDKTERLKCDEFPWISESGSLGPGFTPPNSKLKKPVSASGIFALTQSPLLYKGKGGSATNEITQSDGLSGNSEQFSTKGIHTLNVSPIIQPQRRQACGRTYSRKRLLDP
ncbi:Treslin [Bagarius yarrelli]|uniref:Treslin n=1 Tax=Bagarius yarrelli TaxID=175774 RepID=A0A556THP8_BAGYA|nr:Treslin [Bagarius yarrelli]